MQIFNLSYDRKLLIAEEKGTSRGERVDVPDRWSLMTDCFLNTGREYTPPLSLQARTTGKAHIIKVTTTLGKPHNTLSLTTMLTSNWDYLAIIVTPNFKIV